MTLINNQIGNGIPIYLTDMEVFDQTYKSYYHSLRFYASRFVHPDDAEDIIENLFLKLWKKKQAFKSTEHLQSFLYHAVKNACLDFIKVEKNSIQRNTAFSESQSEINEDPLHSLIKAEVLGEIYRAVNNLPSQCRKVIRMGYLEGLDNAEIASEMGLSEQTVKNYKVRALALLKDKLSGNAFMLFLFLIHWK